MKRKVNLSLKEIVLVTGGAGFIGSHLVDALVGNGYKVRVLDNLAPPTHDGKLPEWFNKKAEYIKGDVRNKKDWERCLKRVDYVFHLAAYMDYHMDFSTFFKSNTESTALLYEVILEKKIRVKKIIVTSSQSVYGEGKYKCSSHGMFYPESRSEEQLKSHKWEVICPKDGKIVKVVPQKEIDEPRPCIPYGISKLAAEKLAITLGKIYKIPSVALRYSIVHGSRQSIFHFYSGALREFSVLALSGQPIRMHEDGNQTRDFVNVHDLVEAHLVVLKDKRADYEIFNIGSGRTTKVYDLAKLVCHKANVKFEPILESIYRLRTARNQPMDISKLGKLGWKPTRSLDNNVEEYLAWVKKYPQAIKYLKKTESELRKTKVINRS